MNKYIANQIKKGLSHKAKKMLDYDMEGWDIRVFETGDSIGKIKVEIIQHGQFSTIKWVPLFIQGGIGDAVSYLNWHICKRFFEDYPDNDLNKIQ